MTMYVVSVCITEQQGPKLSEKASRELALLAVSGKSKLIAEQKVRSVIPAIIQSLTDEDRSLVEPSDFCLCVRTLESYEKELGQRYVDLMEAQNAINQEARECQSPA